MWSVLSWYTPGLPPVREVRVTVLSATGHPVEDAIVWSGLGDEAKKVGRGWKIELPPAKRLADGKLTLFAARGEEHGEATVMLDQEIYAAATIRLGPSTLPPGQGPKR